MSRMGQGGRIVVPAEVRRRLGLEPGDPVILVEEEGVLLVLTPAQAVARARAVVRKYVAPGRSLVGELIAERREEGRRG